MVVAVASALTLLFILPTASAVTEDRPHATVYDIEVDEDGDATWTVELRYQLITQDEIGSFESLREDFEEGEVEVFEGIEDDMHNFAVEAANATGREMSVEGFNRGVEIRDTLTGTEGAVYVTFVWNNFARAEADEVRIGDVFAGGGLSIAGDERLVVQRMDALPLRSVAPETDSSSSDRLVWYGPRFFEEGQPEVVFGEEEEENQTAVNGTQDDTPEPPDSGPSTAATVVAGFFVLLSGFAGGLYLSRRTGFVQTDADEDHDEEGEEIEVESDLMTDEERVVHILEEGGGKMKQAEIVERTDWSKSKVSMLLSDMEEEGTISKLRLGRENVIELEDGGE